MGLSSRIATFVLGLAVLLAWLTDRHSLFLLTLKNHPSRLPQINAFADHKIVLADQIRNCEDVHLDEQRGFAILSCDPGRDTWNTVMGTFINATNPGTLYLYNYASTTTPDEANLHPLPLHNFPAAQRQTFHPLGIAYHPSTGHLFVANHAPTGPTVEVFTLDYTNPQNPFLDHHKTITHPLLHGPNALLAVSPHELYITNDHRFIRRAHPFLAALETYIAYPGGTVVHADLHSDRYKVVAHLPFANGVTALNSTHLAVASTTTPSVTVYRIDPTTKDLQATLSLRVKFLVDNLSTDANGKLVMAGHPHIPALGKVASTNWEVDYGGSGAGKPIGERPRAPSWVAEWDGNAEGKVVDLYVGEEFGSSSTAVRDVGRGVGIVSGLYERGVLVWRE
ncbi:calcium-dependent phosphotriesterase [Aspergillus saccharolyticus JOP 1030-1]|uniref:Calcium-dependent phosphotriesterase n=1 Tax=Aspergillus saccharolyticus JOP 1030-1 TaxID=1450539 RepID=A0A318ZT14_9EURO|nr:calcium-dependent phosphotriesterase [Aspergillus saccharolyticus JOP 1030-1]PYH47100.1 calcium-dependent phosphotriesterase [Aspergillus saccharolyticus JOP 1030-1]